MKLVPAEYLPTGAVMVVAHGDPARARDAREADRVTTWQIAARMARPAYIGEALASGVAYHVRTLVPAFCQYVGVALLASGVGTVTLTNGDDGNDVVATVDAPGLTLAEAIWVWLTDVRDVSTDGFARALEVTDQDTPREVAFTVTIADAGVSTPVLVYQLHLVPLPRGGTPLAA